MELEEYLATGPPFERPIVDEVLARLVDVGSVHIEPVSVGIFLKRAQTFGELRPMTKWMAVSFGLSRSVQSARIARKVIPYGSRYWHVVNVRTPAEVDDELIGWLAEAYDAAPD